MRGKTCGNCRNWSRRSDVSEKGECRANPPQLYVAAPGVTKGETIICVAMTVSKWPETLDFNWCGWHVAATSEAEG